MENQRTSKFLIVSFQKYDSLYTQSRIQLSVIVAKFYLFVYRYGMCSKYEAQFRSVMKLKFERPKIGSKHPETPYLSKELIKS